MSGVIGQVEALEVEEEVTYEERPALQLMRGGLQRSLSKKWNSVKKWGSSRSNSEPEDRYQVKEPGFGLVNFFTLKVIFFDILISFGDVVSDFAQGIALILSDSPGSPNNWIYGCITIGINWLPGFVAAIHLISMYRSTYTYKKILTWAALLIVCYPIVPFLAYINLLWKRPKDLKSQKTDVAFREAEFRAMTAHSISGGIESPIQFILQVWLILNGKIALPWEDIGHVSLKDWYGNELNLPTTAVVSLLFSVMSMFKAVIEFNIVRVHVQDITNGHKILESLEIITDHLPFLASASFFRITSIAFLLTYVNTYAFLPIGLFWLCCVAIGYKSFVLEHIPLWLISFIAIFIPVCFTIHEVDTVQDRENMIKLQYKIFRLQTLVSVILFIPSLCLTMYVINEEKSWNYDSNVILNNLEFNVGTSVIITFGLISYVLSLKPNWFRALGDLNKEYGSNTSSPLSRTMGSFDELDNHRRDPVFQKDKIKGSELKRSCLRILSGLFVLLFVSVPAIVPNVVLHLVKTPLVFVSYAPQVNDTRIIKAIALNGPQETRGCLRNIVGSLSQDNEDIRGGTRRGIATIPGCEKDHILKIARNDWPSCVSMGCYKDSSAILIVDGFAEAANNFRPSFPTKDIELVQKPMLLIQKKDADWFFPVDGRCLLRKCTISISVHNATVPQPEFKCDANESRPIPYDLQKLVDPLTKQIRGRQYRTIQCQWGNRACFGFKNITEVEHFCNEPLVFNYFKGQGGFFWNMDHSLTVVENGVERFIFGKGSQEEHAKCLTQEHIKECDKAEMGAEVVWSEWLRCDETNPQSRIKKRFCEISAECLLQEKRSRVSESECRRQ